MYNVITLAAKDLKLLIRNKSSLFWIFVFPLLLALFFGVTFGGSSSSAPRNVPIAVVDGTKSKLSQALVERLKKTEDLKVTEMELEEAQNAVRKGDLRAYLKIPKGFDNMGALFNPDAPAIELGVDPSRRATQAYLKGMLTKELFGLMQDQFSKPADLVTMAQNIGQVQDIDPKQRKVLQNLMKALEDLAKQANKEDGGQPTGFQPGRIETVEVSKNDAHPRSAFEITFPSSILWGILGCVQAFVISIVTERIGGTFLRLRIAPLSRGHILGGKALACFLTALFVSVVLLVLGRLIFDVRLTRPVHLTMAIVSAAACFVGMLMFLSTLGKTVEGVAGAAWGILMPLAMIGGGMIPLFVMPEWMLMISHFSPVKWGILALEGAIWREFTLQEMLLPCGILFGVGGVSFLVGMKKLSLEVG